MRVILFEVEYDPYSLFFTFVFSILHFDWSDGDASLLEFGVYQRSLRWDFLFLNYLIRRLKWWWEDRKG